MLSCRDAAALITKKNVVGINAMETLQLFLHTRMCNVCYAFKKQSNLMEVMLRREFREDDEISVGALPEEAKQRIIEALKNQ